MESLPKNVLRKIGSNLSVKNRRIFENVINPIPEGLVSIIHPKKAITNLPLEYPRKAKVVTMPHNNESINIIDRIGPHVYKDPNWKYAKHNRGIVYLSINGRQWYTLNKISGQKTSVSRLPVYIQNNVPLRRNVKNTWNQYLKRLNRYVRTKKGEKIRNKLLNNINVNVERYLQGNKTALNQRSYKNLLFYAQSTWGRHAFNKVPGVGWIYLWNINKNYGGRRPTPVSVKTRNELLKVYNAWNKGRRP